MGKTTGIAWCTATWNPWQGCTNADPIKWKIPERIFTCSWSDFFHEDADAWRNAAWDIIDRTRQHTYLILTKSPERIRAHLPWSTAPWPHVWLGTSIESQDYLWRVQEMSTIPATIRFVSAEPLLGPLDLTSIRWPHYVDGETIDPFGSIYEGDELIGISFEPGIHWVIVGGESGPGASPMHPAWPRSIRDQCVSAGVPYFFKQWGGWTETVPVPGGDLGGDMRRDRVRIVKPVGENDGHYRAGDVLMRRVGKKAAGRLLDGREWSEFPYS